MRKDVTFMDADSECADPIPESATAVDERKKINKFAHVLWKVRKNAFPLLHQHGSVIHGDTLIAIAMSENMAMSYTDIESLIGRPQRTLQYILRDLESLGLVVVEHNSEDRRRRTVRLTPYGLRTFHLYIEDIENKIRGLTRAGYCLPLRDEPADDQPAGGPAY